MKLEHSEIKENLPAYWKGSLSSEIRNAVELHLKDCEDCREELSLIAEMSGIEAPDPGELFWKTLPVKVKASVKPEKSSRFSLRSLFFMPLPVATLAIILFFIIFTMTKKTDNGESELFFNNPFEASVIDYSDIKEDDISTVAGQIIGNEISEHVEDFVEYSYHREFASLSSKEMESLYEALKDKQATGG